VDKVSVGRRYYPGRRLEERGSTFGGENICDDGQESISTGDPSDKSDRDILEAVIGLETNSIIANRS